MGNRSYDFPDQSSREAYVIDFSGYIQFVPTSDKSGKLRLVRSGSEITGYYRKSSGWAKISSSTVSTGDVTFGISAWSHDYAFTDKQVKIAFDNFVINKGELTCPTPTPSATPTSVPTTTRTPVPTATATGTPPPPPSTAKNRTSGCTPCAKKTGEPIQAATGEYFTEPQVDINLGGPLPFAFIRSYASRLTTEGAVQSSLGDNWMHNYDLKLNNITSDSLDVVYLLGKIIPFQESGNDWSLKNSEEVIYQLKEDSSGDFYLMVPGQNLVYHFGSSRSRVGKKECKLV